MGLMNAIENPVVIWFLIELLLFILEIFLPGLIILFFGIGACLTALICLIFDLSVDIQILSFLLISIFSLVLLRKNIKKAFFKKVKNKEDTLIDEFIGKTAIAETDIQKGKPGKIIFKGTLWNAKSDKNVTKGQTVKIISKESIVLNVEPINSKTNNK